MYSNDLAYYYFSYQIGYVLTLAGRQSVDIRNLQHAHLA